VIEKLKVEFIQKAEKFKNYKEEVSRFVYEKMIEPAANYSFNKSHAACYAIIAYQTAYLKAHHPVEFYAALLRSVEENTDRFAELLEELKFK
jgi:DNA polymerase-3 subunit alpha